VQGLEAATVVKALEHMLDIAEHHPDVPPPSRLDVAHND
jgi:hypothetical protein